APTTTAASPAASATVVSRDRVNSPFDASPTGRSAEVPPAAVATVVVVVALGESVGDGGSPGGGPSTSSPTGVVAAPYRNAQFSSVRAERHPPSFDCMTLTRYAWSPRTAVPTNVLRASVVKPVFTPVMPANAPSSLFWFWMSNRLRSGPN